MPGEPRPAWLCAARLATTIDMVIAQVCQPLAESRPKWVAAAGGEVMPGMPTNKGDHGYEPDDPDMTALFLVNGPAFRRDARVPAKFDNVDLYPMLARLIGVAPLPNDGDAATLAPLFAPMEK